MIGGICVEVWLAAGYALFLLVAAFVLERLARHCHRRGQRIHTAGFKHRHEIDAWECPTGQFRSAAIHRVGKRFHAPDPNLYRRFSERRCCRRVQERGK